MASTRIPINIEASPVAILALSTLNNLSDVIQAVERLRDIAESAAAGGDWASLASLFGVSQAQAEAVYNNFVNLDNFLNHESASDFLRSFLNQAATR